MSVPETTRAIWEEMAMMTNMKARGKDRIAHMPAKLMYGACKGKYVAREGGGGVRGGIISYHIASHPIPSHHIYHITSPDGDGVGCHITSHHLMGTV